MHNFLHAHWLKCVLAPLTRTNTHTVVSNIAAYNRVLWGGWQPTGLPPAHPATFLSPSPLIKYERVCFMFSPLLGGTHTHAHTCRLCYTHSHSSRLFIVCTHVNANKLRRSKGCHVAQRSSNEKLFYYKLHRKAAGNQKRVCIQHEEKGWRTLHGLQR